MATIYERRLKRKEAELKEVEYDIQIDDARAEKDVNDIIRKGELKDEAFREKMRELRQLREQFKEISDARKMLAEDNLLTDEERMHMNSVIEALNPVKESNTAT